MRDADLTKDEDVIAHLTELARELVEVSLLGDPDHPFFQARLSHDFLGFTDVTGTLMPLEEGMGIVRQVRELDPSYNVHVHGATVDFGQGFPPYERHATVWQFAQVSGSPEGLLREIMILSRWRLQDGVWLCYHFARYRGDPTTAGH